MTSDNTKKIDVLTSQSLDIAQQLLSWMQSLAEQGDSFVRTQAPLFVQELISWFWAKHIFFASVAGIIAIVLWTILYKIWRWAISKEDINDDLIGGIVFLTVFGGGAGVAATIVTLVNVYYVVQLSVAPRVYLAEWIIDHAKLLN
jgi:hypothetical protein